MKRSLPARLLTLTLLGVFGGWATQVALPLAQAQPAPMLTSVSWGSLSASQKAALQPLAERWSAMSPEHQRKWLAVSSNYKQLSPPEQARLHERMLDWAKMSKAERMQARRNYGNAKGELSADERKAKWDAFKSLDDDEREALAREGNPTRIRSTAPAVQPQPLNVKLPAQKPQR
ncbi:hypothetical protein CCO03_12695 [Comamonas serinivorans]|uniref:DUF3106 domain-containing protein n=1 Tax=Comamonas serinivorans TaxID=1082851 RepID=A0A1Y0EPU9_9BURK|nr:DUF3106 domain-containing protein [Comamonas serinivorans]ARU05431.1 hypothetical protein CCO03_12695 [Comamonas serinivorans]